MVNRQLFCTYGSVAITICSHITFPSRERDGYKFLYTYGAETMHFVAMRFSFESKARFDILSNARSKYGERNAPSAFRHKPIAVSM